MGDRVNGRRRYSALTVAELTGYLSATVTAAPCVLTDSNPQWSCSLAPLLVPSADSKERTPSERLCLHPSGEAISDPALWAHRLPPQCSLSIYVCLSVCWFVRWLACLPLLSSHYSHCLLFAAIDRNCVSR